MSKSGNKASIILGVSAILLGTLNAIGAHAQDAASGDTIESIIVTARRVEERLQDVPISIIVFNQEQLSDRNVISASDLATYTPSLSVSRGFGTYNASFAIRGFGSITSTSPSVGIFFADVGEPRANGALGGGDGAGPGEYFDLQNVEVLKGPQGTLFGRNTTGGSILLVPQKPTDKYEGYVEVSGGNYGMEQVQAVVNLPASDNLRFRLGVDHMSRDGYLHNVTNIGPSNFGDVDYTSFRGSMVMDLTPNLENYTILTYSDSDTHGDLGKAFGYNPTSPGAAITNLGASIAAEEAAISGNFWDVANSRPDAVEQIHQARVINTTTWQATDDLTLKNIASYAQLSELHRSSIIGESGSAPLPGPAGGIDYIVSTGVVPGGLNVNESTATEELQLQGHTSDKRLTYQTGVYFEDAEPLGFQSSVASILANCTNPYTYQCSDLIGTAFGIPGHVAQEAPTETKYSFQDFGVYGQATYKIVDQLSLTGGLRYTSDITHGYAIPIEVHFPTPNNPVFSCEFPVPVVIGGTSQQIQDNNALCANSARQSSHAPTWLIDLDYKPIDDVMLYGKYSRGYRQGNVNVSQYGLTSWDPEKVDTYEIGGKTQFDSVVRGTFNIAAFYNNFTDQQLPVNATACTPGQLGTPQCPFLPASAAGIANAGKSKIEGVEADASIIPVKGVRLDFDYTYLYTKLESLNLPAPELGFTSYTVPSPVGGPLAFVPKNKLSLTGSYTLPLDESLGPVTVAATFTYQSSEFNSQTAPPGFQTLGSEKNLNLNLNWYKVLGKPFDFSLFATNVTDEKYYVSTAGIYSGFGYDVAILDPPRMFGARLRYHFGG